MQPDAHQATPTNYSHSRFPLSSCSHSPRILFTEISAHTDGTSQSWSVVSLCIVDKQASAILSRTLSGQPVRLTKSLCSSMSMVYE